MEFSKRLQVDEKAKELIRKHMMRGYKLLILCCSPFAIANIVWVIYCYKMLYDGAMIAGSVLLMLTCFLAIAVLFNFYYSGTYTVRELCFYGKGRAGLRYFADEMQHKKYKMSKRVWDSVELDVMELYLCIEDKVLCKIEV